MLTRHLRVALVLTLLAGVTSARAQTTIVLLEPPSLPVCPGNCLGRLSTIDPDVPRILSTLSIPAASSVGREGLGAGGEYVTPDGAFVVWLEPSPDGARPSIIGLYDASIRAVATLPVSAAARAMVGHPRRTEVFLTDAGGPMALSFAGARPLSGPACAGPANRPLHISADGSRVLYACSENLFGDAFFVDTDTGTTVAMMTLEGRPPALSPDSRSVYRIEGWSPAYLRRYAVDGGALLAEATLVSSTGRLLVEPRTGRVFLVDRTAHVFDGTSLAPVGSAPMPWFGFNVGAGPNLTWTFDPDRPRAYVALVRIEEPGFSVGSYHVLDTEQLLPVLSIPYVPLGWTQTFAGKFVVAPRPAAPVALAANVQGSSVQLTWSPGVSNVTTLRYVVEAGSAPGLANLTTIDVGAQASVLVTGVPPGTYHVRVRAANVTGTSAPSNEIIVTVF